jgi:hypothetical protein
MNRIRVTSAASQKQRLFTPDGSAIGLTLVYKPMQYGWFITELTYKDKPVLQGARVVVSPNLLFQLKNLLPFGLAVGSKDGRDPLLQDDFAQGHSQLLLLNAEEVAAVEELYRE